MLINREVFSLPPYISTSWGHIKMLYMQEDILIVCLTDGIIIKIPQLPSNLLEKIFESHAVFLADQANKTQTKSLKKDGETMANFELPFRIGISSMENMMSSALQHNPEQAHLPNLPEEILSKVTTIAKMLAPEDMSQLPKAEPHCNCLFCQISRTLHHSIEDTLEAPEQEEVAEAEVSSPWLIEQLDQHCYQVSSREDSSEVYKVFLSEGQVGCNCGQSGCEHILAVLRS